MTPLRKGLRPVLRRVAVNALVTCTALAILALILELLFRLAGIGVYEPRKMMTAEAEERIEDLGNGPAYAPNSLLQYTYPANPRGYFDEQNRVIGHINEFGYRGAARPPQKPPGTVRVALLGDSFAPGYGVRDEHTLAVQTEQALLHLGTRSPVEVLNFGVTSFNTPEEVTYLKRYVQSFQPDIVVLLFFLNDTQRSSIAGMLRPFAQRWRWTRRHSHLVNWIFDQLDLLQFRPVFIQNYREGFEEDNDAWIKGQRWLREAQRFAKAHRTEFVLVVHPVLMDLDQHYPFQQQHDSVKRFAVGEGILHLDLLSAFEGQDADALRVYLYDMHPNERAHELAGRALAHYLYAQFPRHFAPDDSPAEPRGTTP